MERTPRKMPPISSVAAVGRNGGTVFLRVQVTPEYASVCYWRTHEALEVADGIRTCLADASVRARGEMTLSLPTGDVLALGLRVAHDIADELTNAAARASGVRA